MEFNKRILRGIKRRLVPSSSKDKSIQILRERNALLKNKIDQIKSNQVKTLSDRNSLLKEKLNDVRDLYKKEVQKNKAGDDQSKQVVELKEKLNDVRDLYKKARIDQRDISPLAHNTEQAMDSFFKENISEEPYIDFANALKTLLDKKQISIDDKAVLDIGTGPSAMLYELLKEASPKSISGIDFSKVAIEQARERIPEGKFAVASIYDKLNMKGDLVFCTEVLEHLENPYIALNNIISAIKPGGTAVITVPDGRVDYSLYHINFWSPESWQYFINNAAEELSVSVGQFRIRETSNYKNNYAIIKK